MTFDLPGKLLSRLKSGLMLLADRGYDADWIRELAMSKGAWANNAEKQPQRSDLLQSLSPEMASDRRSAQPADARHMRVSDVGRDKRERAASAALG